MIYTDLIKKAMILSYEAHRGQYDKGGLPYIFHPFHLAEQMSTEETVVIALLHDVIEDTDWTIDDLEKEGFNEDILTALKLMTHNPAEPYMDYISRLSTCPVARQVKLADLYHNSDQTRVENPDEKMLKRWEKYDRAIQLLKSVNIH